VLHIPQKTLDAVLENWTTADIPERTRTALRLLEKMTLDPMDINQDFIQGLRKDGLTDLEIQEAANVGFHYNLIDRVADAFDFPVPEGIQQKRLARMLNITGRILRGAKAEIAWVRGVDGAIRPPEVEMGRNHFLSVEGATDPKLRRSTEAYVTSQWGLTREGVPTIPGNLEIYLKKLSLSAYKITDEDVQAIREGGYSDEMIYEITIVGAVGVALVGLESLYNVMHK
jgi:hypothetical protein